jgi:DNA-directed RNA polymerase specialized sigma24 family protein
MAEENGLRLESLLEHQKWMKPLARRLVCDDSRADDAVQDTWLAALERSEGRPPPGRGLAPAGAFELRSPVAAQGATAPAARGRRGRREAALGPQELLERAEVAKLLAEAVIRLSEPYRSAILYRYYEDLGPGEIAERLGVPLATVKTRLRRALGMLRDRLDRSGGGREWRLALLPLPALKSPWACPTTLKLGGSIMGLAFKPVAIAASLIVLALVLGGGALAVYRAGTSNPGPAARPRNPSTPGQRGRRRNPPGRTASSRERPIRPPTGKAPAPRPARVLRRRRPGASRSTRDRQSPPRPACRRLRRRPPR